MSRKEKLLSFILLIETLSIAALIYTIADIRTRMNNQLKSKYNNSLLIPTSKDTDTTEEKLEKAELSANVSSHLVWWDQDNGFDSIQNFGKYMYSVSPFWYELTIDGEIEPFSGAEDSEIIEFLKGNDIKILPIISNEFERDRLSDILQDDTKKQEHIEAISQLVEDYDGISLNYENLNEEDKDNYTNFVKDLAEELHSNGKILSVHLHAKTEEPGTWNGPQSQDWEALAQHCDKLKIMAYDYHWSTSEGGAIAPPDWVEDVVKHAKELIPAEKIYLGIPFYGYDWIDEVGSDVTYSKAIKVANLNEATVQFDADTQSPFFSYRDNDSLLHEVWFENSESTKAKLEIAKEYEIGGVDFWRLGEEDPDAWEEVENVFKSE